MSHFYLSLAKLAVKTAYRTASADSLQAKLADQIIEIMGDLGDQEFANARQAFRDARTSSSPRHELTNAINHLQSAASNFEDQEKRELRKKTNWLGQGGSDDYILAAARMKRAQCFALITTIYANLEEQNLVQEYGEKFGFALVRYIGSIRAYDTATAFVSGRLLLKSVSLIPSGPLADNQFSQISQGEALYKLEQYEEALVCYTKALQEEPNRAAYHQCQGQALYELRRYQEALDAFDKAIRLSPDKADCHNWQGVALYNLFRYREAVQAFNNAIQLDPGRAQYHENLKNALSHI